MPKKKGKSPKVDERHSEDELLDDECGANEANASQLAMEKYKPEDLMAMWGKKWDEILEELRDFRQEVGTKWNGFTEDLNKISTKIDTIGKRIDEVEERVSCLEGAVLEILNRQIHLEERQTEQEGRSRRDNIRIHGVKEGAENNAPSVISFVENLLKDKLDLPTSLDVKVERAHRALGMKPPDGASPRSIVVKFASHRTKEEIIKTAWQKKGFAFQERRVNVDHDYAPEVLKKRKEYTEARKVLKEKKIRFQTPFPAKLRVFYQDETVVYSSAEEATKDMAERGLPVKVFKSPETWVEKIKRLTWHTSHRGKTTSAAGAGYKEKLDAYRRKENRV